MELEDYSENPQLSEALGIDSEEIQNNLCDLNSPEIPELILDKITELKNKVGNIPMGVAKLSNSFVVHDISCQIYFIFK